MDLFNECPEQFDYKARGHAISQMPSYISSEVTFEVNPLTV